MGIIRPGRFGNRNCNIIARVTCGDVDLVKRSALTWYGYKRTYTKGVPEHCDGYVSQTYNTSDVEEESGNGTWERKLDREYKEWRE